MNDYTKYNRGTWSPANEHNIENAGRTDADCRSNVYDPRILMYKTVYEKDFEWPEHIPKCNFVRRVEPTYTSIPKPDEDTLKRIYTPKIIFKRLSENKGIVPPLEYTDGDGRKSKGDRDDGGEPNSNGNNYRTQYQDSYWDRSAGRVEKKEETPDEWARRWNNECCNVRDTDDLVQDLCNRIIDTQKIRFSRKRNR